MKLQDRMYNFCMWTINPQQSVRAEAWLGVSEIQSELNKLKEIKRLNKSEEKVAWSLDNEKKSLQVLKQAEILSLLSDMEIEVGS